MINWPFKIDPMSRDEIARAIDDAAWQRFRVSLKGLDTETKLDELYGYLTAGGPRTTLSVRIIRVDNYLNALLRGGQLERVNGTITVKEHKGESTRMTDEEVEVIEAAIEFIAQSRNGLYKSIPPAREVLATAVDSLLRECDGQWDSERGTG